MPTSPQAGEADGAGHELVEAAVARDSIEAGMLQGLLEEAGIPCMVRSFGVDGPQLGFGLLPRHGGPQQVMVEAERFVEARELLAETLVAEEEDAGWEQTANAAHLEGASGARGPRNYGLLGAYARIYAWSFAAIAVAFGVFVLLRAI